MSDRSPDDVVWIEGEDVEPVTPENPLVGLETLVLKTWLERSPALRRAHNTDARDRADIENAVRLRVAATLDEELLLRTQGMSLEEAQSITRPVMWTPPRR